MSYVYVVLARSPSYDDDCIYDKNIWYEVKEYAILGIYGTLEDANKVYYNPNIDCTDQIVEIIYMPFNNKRLYWNNKIKSRYVYPEADTYSYVSNHQSSKKSITEITNTDPILKDGSKSESLSYYSGDIELRKITYEDYAVQVVLPKDYQIDEEIFNEDMHDAKEYQKDIEKTLNENIIYSLEIDFVEAIKEMKISKGILYMFTAIKNCIRSANYNLLEDLNFISEIDPELIGIIAVQPVDIYEISTHLEYKLQVVANILAHRYHSSVNTPAYINAATEIVNET